MAAQPPPETSHTQLSRQMIPNTTAVFLRAVASQISGHISHRHPWNHIGLLLITLLRKAVDIIYARIL